MHERSLARAILHAAVAAAQERRPGRLAAVSIAVGEFSGVEPVLLQSAWDEESAQLLGGAVEFQMQVVPLEAECQSCRQVFRVNGFHFRCPLCDNADVQIVRGEELTLQSVTVEAAEGNP
jgi:hydrogenase nickel incorporation protein HypA/HybF